MSYSTGTAYSAALKNDTRYDFVIMEDLIELIRAHLET